MYRGNGPRTALADAGDAYLHNSQCWHRATPNRSDSTRYLLQNVYGARFVSHWFYPYVNYSLPQNVVKQRRSNSCAFWAGMNRDRSANTHQVRPS